MIKKFLSTFLAIAIVMTMFVFPASAEETFTISMPDGAENYTQFSSSYSPHTLVGTEMIVRPDVTLGEGQKILYFLNGEEVGVSSSAEDFAFKSVYGANKMQAKIVDADNNVVAVSNMMEKTFTQLIKVGTDLRNDTLSSWTATNWYNRTQSAWLTFVADPAGGQTTVMKVAKPSDSTTPPTLRTTEKAWDDDYEVEDTGDGIIKISYSMYAENFAGSLDMCKLQFKAANGTVSKQEKRVIADWPTGALVNKTGSAALNLSRSHTLPTNKWFDVNIVIDNETHTYDVTIDDVQVVTGRTFEGWLFNFELPVHYLGSSYATYYLKNLNIAKFKSAGVTVSTVCGIAPVVAGSKVVINADSTYEGNVNYVYYCNGVRYTDNKVKASAGTNTVYVEAVDSTGRLLGKSKEVTFEAYADTLQEVTKTATIGSYTSTTGTAASISAIGRKYSGSDNIADATRFYYNSIDVKPEITEKSFYILWTLKTADQKEKNLNFFKFTSNGIDVGTKIANNAVDGYVTVPYVNGQDTYNVMTIYNPLNSSYILLVNNVVYSVIDVSATKGTASDLTPINEYFYLDPRLSKPETAEKTNKVTLSNYIEGKSVLPENYSAIEYIYDAEFVTKTSELTSSDDIEVRFSAIKGDYDNVFCIATVVETNGELVSLATKDVDFSSKDTETVSLKLENLPADIENGGYTVNVMLWNKDDLKPIVTKIVMPKN